MPKDHALMMKASENIYLFVVSCNIKNATVTITVYLNTEKHHDHYKFVISQQHRNTSPGLGSKVRMYVYKGTSSLTIDGNHAANFICSVLSLILSCLCVDVL
jgi:hypothetical protein